MENALSYLHTNETSQFHKSSNDKISVLIIDNNEIDNFINKKNFKEYGFSDVSIFTNGLSALSHLKDTKTNYGIILIEVNLPIYDGFDFLEMLYKSGLHRSHGKIFLISSTISPINIVKANNLDIKFIHKPLQLTKMFDIKIINT